MAGKKARVLQKFSYYETGQEFECDDLIEAPVAVIKSFVQGGYADDEDGAVSYCAKELGKEPIKVQRPKTEAGDDS